MAKKGSDHKVPVQARGALRFNREQSLVEISTRDLHTPNRDFPAHLTWIQCIAGSVVVYFAQILPPRRVISLVGVSLNDDAFNALLGSFNAGFRRSVIEMAAKRPGDELRLRSEDLKEVPPDRTFMVTANLGRTTVSTLGGQIDWFQLSPWEMRKLSEDLPGVRDPVGVLTVSLNNALLADLIQQCDELAASLWGGT